jgi:hypothetical protein
MPSRSRWPHIPRCIRRRESHADFEHFRRKVEAGADGALTQLFYNADAYFDFMERCGKAGIRIPIVPGIMPITGYANTCASAMAAAPTCRAGCACAWKSCRTTSRRWSTSAWRGDAPVRDAAAQRRAGAALLHHQPGGPDAAAVEESGPTPRNRGPGTVNGWPRAGGKEWKRGVGVVARIRMWRLEIAWNDCASKAAKLSAKVVEIFEAVDSRVLWRVEKAKELTL